MFLPYIGFDIAEIHNITYASWGETLTLTKVFEPPYEVAQAFERKARAAELHDPWRQYGNNEATLQTLLRRIESPGVMDSHAFKLGISTTAIVGALVAVTIAAVLLYCCRCCPSCLTASSGMLKPRMDYRYFLERLSNNGAYILDESGARNLYHHFNFIRFRQWLVENIRYHDRQGREGERTHGARGGLRVSFSRAPSMPSLAHDVDFDDEVVIYAHSATTSATRSATSQLRTEPLPRSQRPTTLSLHRTVHDPDYLTEQQPRSSSLSRGRPFVLSPSSVAEVLVLSVSDDFYDFYVNAVQTRSQTQAASQPSTQRGPYGGRASVRTSERSSWSGRESDERLTPSGSAASWHESAREREFEERAQPGRPFSRYFRRNERSPQRQQAETGSPGEDRLAAEAAELIENLELADQETGWSFGLTAGFRCEPMVALIDTGSQISLVDKSIALRTGATIKELEVGRDSIAQADGSRLGLIGYIEGALSLRGSMYGHKFFVRPDPPPDMPRQYNTIIGIDLLRKMGQITINFAQQILYLKDMTEQRIYKYKLDPNDRQILLRSTAGPVAYSTPSDRRYVPLPEESFGIPRSAEPGPATSTPMRSQASSENLGSPPGAPRVKNRYQRLRIADDSSSGSELGAPARLQINETRESPNDAQSPRPTSATSSSGQDVPNPAGAASSVPRGGDSPATTVTRYLGNQEWQRREQELNRQAEMATSETQRREARERALVEHQERRRKMAEIRQRVAANLREHRSPGAPLAFDENPQDSDSQPSTTGSNQSDGVERERAGPSSAPPRATVIEVRGQDAALANLVEEYDNEFDMDSWVLLRHDLDKLASQIDNIALNGKGQAPTEAG